MLQPADAYDFFDLARRLLEVRQGTSLNGPTRSGTAEHAKASENRLASLPGSTHDRSGPCRAGGHGLVERADVNTLTSGSASTTTLTKQQIKQQQKPNPTRTRATGLDPTGSDGNVGARFYCVGILRPAP